MTIKREPFQSGEEDCEKPISSGRTEYEDTATPSAHMTAHQNNAAPSPAEHSADPAHDVRNLASPYLGLRSYTYAHRARYAGRQNLIERTVHQLTTDNHQHTLLVIQGLSGSGTSSFAQAGVLPALETAYQQRNLTPRSAVFRPSFKPLDSLLNALIQLGIPAHMLELDTAQATPEQLCLFLSQTTLLYQINLLVIDQFEETFTLSEPAQRKVLLSFLNHLASLTEQDLRTHIVITLRSDYAPDLSAYPSLNTAIQNSLHLHTMAKDELQQAIRQPLEQLYPTQNKHFEPTLLERLTNDATTDASYLPLLQVTLDHIWKTGNLTAASYTTLIDAINHRAENVYRFADYDGPQQQERPETERQMMIEILLELIHITPEHPPILRRRRTATELYQTTTALAVAAETSPPAATTTTTARSKRKKKRTSHQQEPAQDISRSRLIEDLCQANLLQKSVETRGTEAVEVIDIMHEALITHWDRLREAIAHRQGTTPTAPAEAEAEAPAMTQPTPAPSDPAAPHTGQTDDPQRQARQHDVNSTARTLASPRPGASSESEPQPKAAATTSAFSQEFRNLPRKLKIASVLIGIALVLLIVFSIQASIRLASAERQARSYQTLVETAESRDRLSTSQLATAQAEQNRIEATAAVVQQTSEVLQQAAEARDAELQLQNLILQARSKLESNPELGTLLALEAAKIDEHQSPVIENLLRQAIQVSYIRLNLHGHRDVVWSAAFSPDGQRIVTASDDDTARVWSAYTGEELTVLRGHRAGVWSAAFSPDGQRIVTASEDQTARVWSTTTGEELLVIKVGEGRVNHVAFSPDGDRIVTASTDRESRVWNAATGEEIEVLQGVTGARSATYSPDGERIITANLDNQVRIWNADNGRLFYSLSGHSDVVWSAAYSTDGARIVTASSDRTVRIWNAQTGRQEQVFENVYARDATFSPDGNQIVTANWDGTARAWDANNGTELFVLRGHTAVVMNVAYSPDGQRIVTAGSDKKVRLWDAGTGAEVLVLKGHENGILDAAYSPNGTRIATASFDNTARVWDAMTGQTLLRLEGHNQPVSSIAYRSDGLRIVTSSLDNTARVWDATTGASLLELTGHEQIVWSAAYSPDGTRIVTASDDKTARLWNAETGEELIVFRGHTGNLHSARFSPDGNYIVTSSGGNGDNTARLWNAETGKQLLILEGHTQSINSATYSPNGNYVVTTSEDHTARIWDTDTGETVTILDGHTGSVHSGVFSSDSTRVLTASSDQTARLWDVETGKELTVLKGHGDRVNSAAFSPDGRYIITASQDRTVRIYYAHFKDILALARQSVTRELTSEEERLYLMNEPDSE